MQYPTMTRATVDDIEVVYQDGTAIGFTCLASVPIEVACKQFADMLSADYFRDHPDDGQMHD